MRVRNKSALLWCGLLATLLSSGTSFAQTFAPRQPTPAQLDQQLQEAQARLALLQQQKAKMIADAQARVAADTEFLAKNGVAVGKMQVAAARTDGGQGQAASPDLGASDDEEDAGESAVTTTTTTPDGTTIVKEEPFSQSSLRDAKDGTSKFGGIDFGVGVSFSYDLGGETRVKEAQVVNGIVRVSHADNARARLVLESHYFFTPDGKTLFGLENEPGPDGSKQWGIGPFIALQPGSDAVIDAIGAGLMVGFKRAGEGNDSFNIGLGIIYDVDARVLGEGIVENEPLPVGETEIRYQQRDQSALLVMTSYSF